MYKLLRNRKIMAGTAFAEIDSNFIAVVNALVKMANPDLTVQSYVTPSTDEPSSPSTNDAYLVIEAGTVWSLTVAVNNIITWNGSAWEKESFTLNELNTVLQSLFFDAENVACVTPYGMTATDVQSAIEEIAAEVFGVDPSSSGSGSGSV